MITEQGFGEMFKAGQGRRCSSAARPTTWIALPKAWIVGCSVRAEEPDTGSNTTFAWTASTVINAATQHPEEACDALLAVTEGIQNWKIVSPRISQATVEHLVASEPRKEANAQAIIDAAPEHARVHDRPASFCEWNDVLWSRIFLDPLLNKQTDLSRQIWRQKCARAGRRCSEPEKRQ